MCGRYSAYDLHLLGQILSNLPIQMKLPPRPTWNAAPSQILPVLVEAPDEEQWELTGMSWGLVPRWAKPGERPKVAPINARAETLTQKPMFRSLVKRNRCIVPANGFYEWKKEGSGKQPYYIHLRDEPMMFFAGLFAMYFTLRSTSGQMWAEETAKLNFPFALVNTIVLVASSFTCQMGVFAAERLQPRRLGGPLSFTRWGMNEWFTLTFIMGAFFVAGQATEYAMLVSEHVSLSSNAYGSAFYMTTGFHGLHVIGGLIAFLLIIGRSFAAKKFGHFEATSAIVTSYYWHFVDVVWIGLFLVIYVLK